MLNFDEETGRIVEKVLQVVLCNGDPKTQWVKYEKVLELLRAEGMTAPVRKLTRILGTVVALCLLEESNEGGQLKLRLSSMGQSWLEKRIGA